MVVGEALINNIMGGIGNTGSVRLHNHKRKLKQRFDIIKKLGQGTYGKVQLGINKETGQEVAIKTIKKSKIDTEADLIRIRREIQIMSSVQHPNIIHIYEVFENREKIVIVMEYAAGGELYDFLFVRKMLAEEEARRIFRQIATACYYCHKHKICHRDLKLENILLDEHGAAKIADFGLSNVFDDHRHLSTYCGSPLYASPEIVKGTPYHGPEVDCWSLGVLLYTLVYGAMPFDGSNFKRLVKSISQGDYFEPQNPSRASSLIHEMLTVNPAHRASIEKICAHWWVNEGYDESCLDISEELANQTPVRLDVLLSLNPPPAQLEADKLVLTGEPDALPEEAQRDAALPTRSLSMGSLMEIGSSPEKRIKELMSQDKEKATPKRKLDATASIDQANAFLDGKRREKIVKESTVADVAVPKQRQGVLDDVKMAEKESPVDPSLQGAACAEIIEEHKQIEVAKKQAAAKEKKLASKIPEAELTKEQQQKEKKTELMTEKESKGESKSIEDKAKIIKEGKGDSKGASGLNIPAPRKKIVKKKVVADKNDSGKAKEAGKVEKDDDKKAEDAKEVKENASEITPMVASPAKGPERRQSRIFEQTEKFQSLISANDAAPSPESQKPKKIVIPGVSVGCFKKEFERRASLTSSPKVKNAASRKLIIDDKKESVDLEQPPTSMQDVQVMKSEPKPDQAESTEDKSSEDAELKKKMKNAVSIISNALDKEGARKSKSRPCMARKPLLPFGVSGRSASGSIGMLSSLIPSSPKPFTRVMPTFDAKTLRATPEVANKPDFPTPSGTQTSSAEITLKSATLPRRKSAKAQIQLDYPRPKPAAMEFKTEMSHPVQAAPSVTQRTEISFPVGESKKKEHIIPIAFESSDEPQATKPPMPRNVYQSQRSLSSQRADNLSRQATQESDNDSATTTGEPIKKSPREYIIPIAVEGGGYVTPRAGSLEPSEPGSTMASSNRLPKFRAPRRMMSLFDRDGSEDESPFSAAHRYSSFGRDSDNESDAKRNAFHRLRSSRPRKAAVEHADSVSSGEDDDDDDGFEFLTAENLFSTLLSRVRNLTHRDPTRPSFPSSRFLKQFDHESFFGNRMEPLGLTRNSSLGRQFSRERSMNSSTPWRRSVSRDLASDIDSVFKEHNRPTHTTTIPRGERIDVNVLEHLHLNDLNLRKLALTEEDALALSYLTPGLSRRIQKQLFASLPASEAKRITRTLSMRHHDDDDTAKAAEERLRKYDKRCISQHNLLTNSNAHATDLNQINSITNRTSLKSLREPIAENHVGESKSEPPRTRRISRFLRPDFFDPPKEENVVVKEKKERERETQQVLKEIRDKRIKNRLNSRRERSLSKEKELETNGNTEKQSLVKCKELVDALTANKSDQSNEMTINNGDDSASSANCKETQTLLNNVSDNIKNIESNVLSRHSALKTSTASKLVRPKSYPTDTGTNCKSKLNEVKQSAEKEKVASKISKLKKPTATKLKTEKTAKLGNTTDDKSEKVTKNKFLQSIEKKFGKLKSLSTESGCKEDKADKSDTKAIGGVETTIQKLREQSEPKDLPHMTESVLIKRAVSVEDFSNVKAKAIQPSRKSVSKILNLFKKYEEKEKPKEAAKSSETALADISETNIPVYKARGNEVTASREITSPERSERPKSLISERVKRYNGSRGDNLLTTGVDTNIDKKSASKLPVNSCRKSLETRNGDDASNNNVNLSKSANRNADMEANNMTNMKNGYLHERRNLKLDLKNLNSPSAETSACSDYNLNRISYATDDSATLLSPCDETTSCDSWSVCSDLHHQDLLSPLSPNGNTYSADENESVIDRIRRRSFYTRFNEARKKPRKSIVGNYRDLDLCKDYSQRTFKYKSCSPLDTFRKCGGYSSSGEGDDYRPYTHSKLLSNEYAHFPQRYQTYNPRKTNIASLYSPGDEGLTAGTYKRYNYNSASSTSQLSSLSRSSRSPSSDLQSIPQNLRSQRMSMTSDMNSPSTTSALDVGNNVNEHAV